MSSDPLVGASPGGVLGAPTSQDRPKCAQPWVSPARLVERFYDRAGFPDRASFYTGEMLEHYSDAPTLGLLLPDDVRVQHRSVLVGCERAVYATTTSTPEHGEDWYLHMLWEDGGWKIEAVRKLAVPGFFYLMLEEMAANPDLMEQGATVPGAQVPLAAGAEVLTNMRLVVSTDAALKDYFARHRAEILQLVAEFEQRPALTFVASDGRARPEGSESGAIAAQIQQLHLNYVSRQAGCIVVSIGGVLDNEVGYLYAPPSCTVPEMSPNLYILVEPIADEWFLFKTT
jgi:hypothetical protein